MATTCSWWLVEEVVDAAQVARRGLRGLRVMAAGRDFLQELGGGHAHLVEEGAVREMDAQGHGVNAELVEYLVGQVGAGVRHDRRSGRSRWARACAWRVMSSAFCEPTVP